MAAKSGGVGQILIPIQLEGENAFYNKPTYRKDVEAEFHSASLLPVTYRWETESKIRRIAKFILSVIIFPIAIYKIMQILVGKLVVQGSFRFKSTADAIRKDISLDKVWKYHRFTIEVDGVKIDAVMQGNPETLGNGKWMLFTNGNAGLYEELFSYRDEELDQWNKHLGVNALVYNYPDVGASKGYSTPETLVNTHRAFLAFLREQVGANTIYLNGHSLGGIVQGETLNVEPLQDKRTYVCIKSRSLSSIRSYVASSLWWPLRPLSYAVSFFGWNMSSVESSKKLQVPEIILQSADTSNYDELSKDRKILISWHDGVVPQEATIGYVLLADPTWPMHKNKVIYGIPESHDKPLTEISVVTKKILSLLPQSV